MERPEAQRSAAVGVAELKEITAVIKLAPRRLLWIGDSPAVTHWQLTKSYFSNSVSYFIHLNLFQTNSKQFVNGLNFYRACMIYNKYNVYNVMLSLC